MGDRYIIGFLKTPFGYLKIHADELGVFKLEFFKEIEDKKSLELQNVEDEILRWATYELDLYFTKKLKSFTVPINLKDVTPFVEKVLKQTENIDYGDLKTYKDIAKEINTKGYRAIGLALSKNPIPIFIPCHRVIKSDGRLGGYRFGKDLKKSLLKIEGINLCT